MQLLDQLIEHVLASDVVGSRSLVMVADVTSLDERIGDGTDLRRGLRRGARPLGERAQVHSDLVLHAPAHGVREDVIE